MRKIIFLDIDGVLADENFLMGGQGFIDPEKIKLLNQLSDAEIVISSSWGEDDGDTEKSLRECGLELPIIGYTRHFYLDYLCRGNEIDRWLNEEFHDTTKFGGYDSSRYQYVILDDDEDMLRGQDAHFIHLDRRYALCQEHIDLAKDILNGKL